MHDLPLAHEKTGLSSSATQNPIINGGQNFTASQEITPFAHPIPDLPVLNELVIGAKDFLSQTSLRPQETAIIGAQHILETTATLLGKFRELGFEVYITGKVYSTCPAVYRAMLNLGIHVWPGSKPEKLGEYQAACEKDIVSVLQAVEQNPKIKNIIVLDDGGRFYEKMPPHFRRKFRMSGVEQTRAGFYSENVVISRMPIVNVAQCAAKVMFESPFIAQAAVTEISSITQKLDKSRCVIGIIGFGAIGQALAAKLLEDGFAVSIYDKDPESYRNHPFRNQLEVLPTIKELFRDTNFIIGCTGQDSTESFDPLGLNGHDRMLASVSSEDKEFKKLLKAIDGRTRNIVPIDPLSTIRCYTTAGNILEILYGGFPVNFANSHKKPFNVPANDIALTQALLFCAVIQAVEHMEQPNTTDVVAPTNMMLSPVIQQKVVKLWHEKHPEKEKLPGRELMAKFIVDKTFVVANSKGTPKETTLCQYVLPESSKIKAKL